MVQLCYGNLKIHLCLNEIQFRSSELSLGIENEKDRFGAQFVFSFIGMEGFSPEVHGDFSRLHGEFGFFQRVHSIGNFQRDALRRAAFLVLILATADQSISEIRLRRVSPYWQVQRECGSVGRIGELEGLVQTAAQSYVKP